MRSFLQCQVVKPPLGLDEIPGGAAIDPVLSGGIAPRSAPARLASLTDLPINTADLIAAVASASDGAVSVFIGTVRNQNEGRAVTGITYEGYLPMAQAELEAIASEVCMATPGVAVGVMHRLGYLSVGEVSVAIAASHAHRRQAISACTRVIEEIKVRLPVWKHEHYVGADSEWLEGGGAETGHK